MNVIKCDQCERIIAQAGITASVKMNLAVEVDVEVDLHVCHACVADLGIAVRSPASGDMIIMRHMTQPVQKAVKAAMLGILAKETNVTKPD